MCFRILLWSTNKLPISLLKFTFPKETKKKKKKCFRKFIPTFVSSDTTSKPLYQTDSPMKWLVCVSLLFFFFLAFHFCFSLTGLSQQCQKGPALPKTAAVNEIQPLIRVFLPRLAWVYFAILERWLLFQSALPLISQLSKAAKFVLAVFSFWAFFWTSVSTLPFLSCLISRDKHTRTHTHTHAGLSRIPSAAFMWLKS